MCHSTQLHRCMWQGRTGKCPRSCTSGCTPLSGLHVQGELITCIRTCTSNTSVTQCSSAPPPYVLSSSAPPTLCCRCTCLEQSSDLHSDTGHCRQLQRRGRGRGGHAWPGTDASCDSSCDAFGHTMTAVRCRPALSAHTAVRGDARSTILAGRGASGCREEEEANSEPTPPVHLAAPCTL